jgi:alcohol dehydrogenase
MDAELTLPVPPAVTAVAGISAFAHALEAFVSLGANELTGTLAAEAVRLVGRNLVRAVRDGTDIEAKTALCLAAYLAGAAANGAGLGVASLLAHPLGMTLGTQYAEALAIVLPASIEFNYDHARDKYALIRDLLTAETEHAAQRLSDVLAALYHEARINDVISPHRIDYGKIEETLSAIEKSHVRARGNPRPVDRTGLVRVLRRAREYIHQQTLSRGSGAT